MKSKIVIYVFMLLLLVGVAAARVTPTYEIEYAHGLVAAEYMAIIAIVCAFVDNVGRYVDKKRADPNLKYNFAYLKATLIAITLMGLGVLGMDVVSLGLEEILTAVIIGFGGNVAIKDATKGTR
jgi:hypothetical protein